MSLNGKQKAIIVVCIVLIIGCWLFPPTEGRGRAETINYHGLLINWLGILILSGLAILLAKGPVLNDPERINKRNRLLKNIGKFIGGILLIIILGIAALVSHEKYKEIKATQERDLAACQRVERKLENNTPLDFYDLQKTIDNQYCDPEYYGYKKVINGEGANYFVELDNESGLIITREQVEGNEAEESNNWWEVSYFDLESFGDTEEVSTTEYDDEESSN